MQQRGSGFALVSQNINGAGVRAHEILSEGGGELRLSDADFRGRDLHFAPDQLLVMQPARRAVQGTFRLSLALQPRLGGLTSYAVELRLEILSAFAELLHVLRAGLKPLPRRLQLVVQMRGQSLLVLHPSLAQTMHLLPRRQLESIPDERQPRRQAIRRVRRKRQIRGFQVVDPALRRFERFLLSAHVLLKKLQLELDLTAVRRKLLQRVDGIFIADTPARRRIRNRFSLQRDVSIQQLADFVYENFGAGEGIGARCARGSLDLVKALLKVFGARREFLTLGLKIRPPVGAQSGGVRQRRRVVLLRRRRKADEQSRQRDCRGLEVATV